MIAGAIQLTILLDALALIGCGFFFFLGCDNLKIAGATFPYFNRYVGKQICIFSNREKKKPACIGKIAAMVLLKLLIDGIE